MSNNIDHYAEYRKEILANPTEYPELFRIETAKNAFKFSGK